MNIFDRFQTVDLPLFDSVEPINPSAAAKADINERIPELRRKVLEALKRNAKGLTDEEIQSATGLVPNCARPRRRELVQGGYVCDSGRRRPLVSGKMGTVWVVVEKTQ